MKAKVARMAKAANTLYNALLAFNIDHSAYPSTSSFNDRTLDPLVEQGYLRVPQGIVNHLYERRITTYAAIEGDSEDSECYAVLTLDAYPSVQIVVADTASLPGFSDPVSGAYFIHGSELMTLDEDILKALGR